MGTRLLVDDGRGVAARKVFCMGPLQPLLPGLFFLLLFISPLWPHASTAVDVVGGQGQLRVNRCRFGRREHSNGRKFYEPLVSCCSSGVFDKFGVQHNKRRRPSSFYCVAFKGGDDTLVPVDSLYTTILSSWKEHSAPSSSILSRGPWSCAEDLLQD